MNDSSENCRCYSSPCLTLQHMLLCPRSAQLSLSLPLQVLLLQSKHDIERMTMITVNTTSGASQRGRAVICSCECSRCGLYMIVKQRNA